MQNAGAKLQEGTTAGIHSALDAKMKGAQIKLLNAQADALQPAAKLGEGVGGAVDWAGTQLKDLDWMSMLDRAKEDTKGVAISFKEAKNRIYKAAESVGLQGYQAYRQLVDELDQMDLPKEWSTQRKIIWAVLNQKEVQAFRERQKRNQQ